jgi:hypothetical protein
MTMIGRPAPLTLAVNAVGSNAGAAGAGGTADAAGAVALAPHAATTRQRRFRPIRGRMPRARPRVYRRARSGTP